LPRLARLKAGQVVGHHEVARIAAADLVKVGIEVPQAALHQAGNDKTRWSGMRRGGADFGGCGMQIPGHGSGSGPVMVCYGPA